MTIRDDYFDESYVLEGYNSIPQTVTKFRSRVSNGADRTAADKLAGLWPEHAYTATHVHEHAGAHWVIAAIPGWLANGEGSVSGSTPAFTSSEELQLTARLADKIRMHDWNAAIFVGELGKTVDTVVSRTKQLARAVISVRRGLVREALSILQANPKRFLMLRGELARQKGPPASWYSTWLEIRYAWRPLVKDVWDLSEAIRTFDKPRAQVIRASIKKLGTIGCSQPDWFQVDGMAQRRLSVKAVITELLQSPEEHLGLNNPSEVFWELVPLSFVADWFIPIGNYIRARSVIQNVTGTYTTTMYNWHDAKYVAAKPEGLAIGRSLPFGESRRYEINRSISTTYEVPLPFFRNPAGPNPGTRFLDALALLSAAVKGNGGRLRYSE